MMAIDDGRNKNMDTHANRKAGMGFHQEWSFALPGAKPSRKQIYSPPEDDIKVPISAYDSAPIGYKII